MQGVISGLVLAYRLKTAVIYISESAIDAIFVATLRKNIGKVHCLSIGGAYAPKGNTSQANLPKTLEQYLKYHTEIQSVELFLDYDAVGIGASFFLMNKLLGMGYAMSYTSPVCGKDWKEYILKEKSAERREKTP